MKKGGIYMFENDKINYAIIVIGDRTIEGECTSWEIVTSGTGTYAKVIINHKQYIVGINNVLFTEK